MTTLLPLVRDLHRRKARERRGLTIVEGIRLVEEAVSAGVPLHGVLFDPSAMDGERATRLLATLRSGGVPCEAVESRAFDPLALTETPQGILAVAEVRRWALQDVTLGATGVGLVLDAVQDPGNAGGLVRTAAALGVDGTIALPGTVDLWNPKALRGAMGATFRHPVARATAEAFVQWTAACGAELWVADGAGDDVRSVVREGPVLLVVGNEGAGASPVIDGVAHRRVAVPIKPDVESLNVGVAAAIILYEVVNR